MIPQSLRDTFTANGQSHVFQYADKAGVLTPEQVTTLVSQLSAIDVPLVNALYSATMAASAAPPSPDTLKPCTEVIPLATTPAAQVEAWREAGLGYIRAGQAAALILAGGQGTRLGFDRPKGEYNLSLHSQRSLFSLQAARVQRLRVMAAAAAPAASSLPSLPLYIMTSPMTDADTREYWAANHNFGLPQEDVVFFSQGTLPCLSPEGKILLESGGKVAEAPDGNGGIYRGMHLQGVVADMKRRGVLGVHVFAVDNAIVRPADPVFMGLCIGQGVDVGSKVCPKAGPHEKVGVLCKVEGRYSVVEYSEMDRGACELVGGDGRLVYNTGNLCIHYYSTAFLEGPCSPEHLPKVYHLAKKSIPVSGEDGLTMGKEAMAAAFGGKPNGIKLESFIFDVFPAASTMAVVEIERAAEFSPVKNAPGSADDSPDTARAQLSALHTAWVVAAGGKVEGEGLVEVSPTVSYAGEGLGELKGRVLKAPLYIHGVGETPAVGGVTSYTLSSS